MNTSLSEAFLSGPQLPLTEEIVQKLETALLSLNGRAPLEKIVSELSAVAALVELFENSPRGLDPSLKTCVPLVCVAFLETVIEQPEATDALGLVIYAFAKIRGHKAVANHFPSDVYVIPRLVLLLSDTSVSARDRQCLLLLLWLSRLVLVPFPLESVEPQLPNSLLGLVLAVLGRHNNASKNQAVALGFLALLLTRPDCADLFLQFQQEVFHDWPSFSELTKLGHLMTFNLILKKQRSPEMLNCANQLYPQVISYEMGRLSYVSSYAPSALNALYLVKVTAKLAIFHTQKTDYSTAAELINHLVNCMSLFGDQFSVNLREVLAKNLARVTAQLSLRAVNYASQLCSYMVSQILPKYRASDAKYTSTLDIPVSSYSVPKFHTMLLYIGFLALTRACPTDFVPVIFSLTHQSLFFSRTSRWFTQGTQIRDASCFCCWASLRMLNGESFHVLETENPGMTSKVFTDLVKVCIFDEDFLIRRCAMATLQEFVGRYGSAFFQKISAMSDAECGKFTIDFIGCFGNSALSSPDESHELLHVLLQMGFPASVFIKSLVSEITNEQTVFRIKRLGSIHLARVMAAKPSGPCLNLHLDTDTGDIFLEFLRLVNLGEYAALFALAEAYQTNLLTHLQVSEAAEFASGKIDHHKNDVATGISVLHWLNVTGTRTDFRNILEISRMQWNEDLMSELQTFFDNRILSQSEFHDVVKFLSAGNKLLAASILHCELTDTQLETLEEFLRNPNVDAEIRALTLSNAKSRLHSRLSALIVELLDDYTISTRGDVGLMVRFACIESIAAHKCLFSKTDVRPKLLRIAGESLDKLRFAALETLLVLDNIRSTPEELAPYRHDYGLYFSRLLSIFDKHWRTDDNMTQALFNGFVYCTGASAGTNNLINESFRVLLRYLATPKNAELVFSTYLKMLKTPEGKSVANLTPREQKTLQATMNTVAKIFESGANLLLDLNFESLFVRVYNLHINTTNVPRVAMAVRIFRFMASSWFVDAELRKRAMKRIIWISCNHSIPKLRRLAGDAVYDFLCDNDACDEELDEMEQTDWETKRPGAVKMRKLQASIERFIR